MQTKLYKITCTLILILYICTSFSQISYASDNTYTNVETGYQIMIYDEALLLTEEEKIALQEVMKAFTNHGHAVFTTVNSNPISTEYYAELWYQEFFSYENGMIFLIDMDNRILTIYCEGDVADVITDAYATTITDNVYRYASNEEYYLCASTAFSQACTLLNAGEIMQPMKYISNALLAMLLSLLILFGYVSYYSRIKQPSDDKLLERIHKQFSHSKPVVNLTNETKTYSPQSSGSSSSHHSSSHRSSSRRSSGSSRSRSSSSRSRSSSSRSRSSSRGSHRF